MWKGTVYWFLFFLCLVTDISVTVALISVKFCMMIHIGPGKIFSFFGVVLQDPKIQNFGPLKQQISQKL